MVSRVSLQCVRGRERVHCTLRLGPSHTVLVQQLIETDEQTADKLLSLNVLPNVDRQAALLRAGAT
jgi:hypothetical protein